jgi:hypothetical protein
MQQGIAALQDPQLQKILSVSSVKPQDLPRIASAAGVSYENLPAEQKESLKGLVEELRGFSPDELLAFDKFLTFIAQHKDRYAELVDGFYKRGVFQEGELPKTYDENFFSMIHAMVVQTMQQQQSQPAPEQAMAKGGIASVRKAAAKVRAAGRDGDTILAHINPQEAALLKAHGGSGTINPKTGLPEYKSIFSKIGKFLGAAAPILGTVVGSFFGMPFLGSVLGGAVGGLASGGGVKGALLGAAMSGIGSLAFGGLSSLANGGGFMEGVTNTLPGYLGGSGESFGGTLFGSGANVTPGGPGPGDAIDPSTGKTIMPPARPESFGPSGTGVAPSPGGTTAPATTAAAASTAKTAGDTGIFKSIMDNKGLLATAGIGALLAGSAGGSKAPATPLSVSHPALTEAEREAKYPWTVIDSKNFVSKTPSYTADQNQYSWLKPTTETQEVAVATGGRIDARGGGHLEGPGTGTSDSIKAKLSDGEFVMTAKAVRGAGKGDRMAGAKKMYDLMHKFERAA